MQTIFSADLMKMCDHFTSQELLMPQDLLIERAAVCVVQFLEQIGIKSALFVCGPGNNGADGIAAARIMMEHHLKSAVCLVGEEENRNEAVVTELERYRKLGGQLCETPVNDYEVIVDAIFGIGLSRNVKGCFEKVIQELNYLHEQGTHIVSIDIASGIHTDTGVCMGTAVYADDTVVISGYKVGNLFGKGRIHSGNLHLVNSGICTELATIASHNNHYNDYFHTFCFEKDEYRQYLNREKDGNKSTFGKVLAVTGNDRMAGACILSASACMHTGCGLLYVLSEEKNRLPLIQAVPEAIFTGYHSFFDSDSKAVNSFRIQNEPILQSVMSRQYDCILIGCGIGTGTDSIELLRYVIQNSDCSLVLDADALNLLAENEELWEILRRQTRRTVILTPHPGEMARLLHLSVSELTNDYIHLVSAYARSNHCIIIGKNAVSIVTDGNQCFINTAGNDGMGTAGSGDVLAGITASFTAVMKDAFFAACTACHVHALAGDYVAEHTNHHFMTAGTMIEGLSHVL